MKETLSGAGSTVAADCDILAPALYDADKYYIVPRIHEPGYLDAVLEICRREKISGVISLIDPEVNLLAKNADKLEAVGAKFIGSTYELCEMAYDKMKMYEWLKEHGYNCARSWMDPEEFLRELKAGSVRFPVFVKPARGSASIGICEAHDMETVNYLFSHQKGMMIQELLPGQEIGADVYIDMVSGETISIFTKKKIRMRAGETDKSLSFIDKKLFRLIEQFVRETGYVGPIDMDIFDVNGEYVISEVNPRFGGGYPHAYEAGCNFIRFLIHNLLGKANDKQIGAYEEGVCMMKYSDVKIVKGVGLDL